MKSVNTGICEISFDEMNSILHMRVIKDAEMSLRSTIEHYRIIHSLVNGRKYAALVDSSQYFTITPEALEYSSSPAALKYRIAAAHYNLHLANKITTTFFKSHCTAIPVSNFRHREEALVWLVDILEKEELILPENALSIT